MKTSLIIGTALTMVACAPTATTQSTNQIRSYAATPKLIYQTIVEVISADPGVPAAPASGNEPGRLASGAWKILNLNNSNSIEARAESVLVDASGADTGHREPQRISVVLLPLLSNTQVTIVSSEDAIYLRDKIIAKLNATYPTGR